MEALRHSETRSAEHRAGSLDGVRVLDLTRMLSGPYCTQMLADQGAEVIKVEEHIGDQSRSFGPHRPDDNLRLFGGYFASVNRNKKSIVVDLKQEDGKKIIRELARECDVLVENFRPGVMDRLGLSYESLRAENPALVYAAIRGFGDPRTSDSPYMNWPAYDVTAQAMGGMMGITGPDSATPMKVGPGVGDIIPGAFAVIGILCALLHARSTGQGQFVAVSMIDSVLAVCERIVHQYSFAGDVAKPEGNQHPILTPFGLFKASDGYVTLAAPSDEWWAELCRLIGREDMLANPALATMADRTKCRPEVYGAIEAFTSTRSKSDLLKIFGGRLPFGPVYSSEEIFLDRHFAQVGMLPAVEQPGSATSVQLAGVPIRMTETDGAVRTRPPLLGEHTDAVLASLGFSPERIRTLKETQVIK